MSPLPVCPIHRVEFSGSCRVCNEELRYVGRAELVDHFRHGFEGSTDCAKTPEEKAAYEHGRKCAGV